ERCKTNPGAPAGARVKDACACQKTGRALRERNPPGKLRRTVRGGPSVRSLLFVFCCAAVAETPAARIKIDIDRQIGEVDALLFGNFAEHLGRMIYGGIYDEGNSLSDSDGYRKDVIDVVKKLGVSILRYPGGNFSSGYDWKDGIGPKDQRPMRVE